MRMPPLRLTRALASDAPVILADEPTGNLDTDTAGEITAVLKESAHAFGKHVLVDTEIQILRERWANMPASAAEGIQEFSGIFYVELLNESTAAAKIACAKLDNYFNDFFG